MDTCWRDWELQLALELRRTELTDDVRWLLFKRPYCDVSALVEEISNIEEEFELDPYESYIPEIRVRKPPWQLTDYVSVPRGKGKPKPKKKAVPQHIVIPSRRPLLEEPEPATQKERKPQRTGIPGIDYKAVEWESPKEKPKPIAYKPDPDLEPSPGKPRYNLMKGVFRCAVCYGRGCNRCDGGWLYDPWYDRVERKLRFFEFADHKHVRQGDKRLAPPEVAANGGGINWGWYLLKTFYGDDVDDLIEAFRTGNVVTYEDLQNAPIKLGARVCGYDVYRLVAALNKVIVEEVVDEH